MAMTSQERAELAWLRAEVSRLREMVERRQADVPALNHEVWGRPAEQERKPDHERTVAEVMEERRHSVTGGCCERHADNMGCDCLDVARRYEASLGKCPECRDTGYTEYPDNGRNRNARRCSRRCPVRCSICNDPECGFPGGQH
jgi:hypothetical protein